MRHSRSCGAEAGDALLLDSGDPYLKAAYADFLLDNGRPTY